MVVDIGTLLTIAQHLYNVLQSSQLREIREYKFEIEKLIDTISTIKNALLDADRSRCLTNEQQGWIGDLKNVLYDADDLLDEFDTLVEGNKDVTLLKKVGDFVSLKNLFFAYKMRKEINEIKNKLDQISCNHKRYGSAVTSELPREKKKSYETGSRSYASEVIGRDDSVNEVVDMLRQLNVKEVSFLTIVGPGGLGKTTLAQLVYRNERIREKFVITMWVSVSDHRDNEPFELEVIFCKMLESITKKPAKGIGIDHLQGELKRELRGKTFLLVLDDVWTEDYHKWDELRNFLNIGGHGSAILVTSRSKMAKRVKGNINYELEVLAPENSWILFKKIALGEEQNDEFIEIGKRIVGKCYDNPLAITVVARMLYSKEKEEWESFENIELAGINEGEEIGNKIFSILKLSYYNLEPALKSCFSYCALFPKDIHLGKDMLISLWIAQGYIVPFHQGQSIENAAEEHFSILLQRCFFQDVNIDEYGVVLSCKIHNLMHDVAKEVAKKEIGPRSCTRSAIGHNYRHLYDNQSTYSGDSFTKSRIRSYFQTIWALSFPVDTLLANWVYLRALDLHGTGIRIVPASISGLLHLRYLDLSWNGFMETIPNSITKIHNLQFLNLDGCYLLKELPIDMRKLVKLRYLNLNDCHKLTYMPAGMDQLIELRVLTTFIVSPEDPSEKLLVGKMEDLNHLANLKGKIDIFIYGMKINEEAKEQGYLRNLGYLKEVSIHFLENSWTSNDEILLAKLQPNPNLKGFRLLGYKGKTIPRWRTLEDNNCSKPISPNLIKLELISCKNLENIPSLRKLPHLKSMRLDNLWNLEYMENTSPCYESKEVKSMFFPSLEILEITGLPKLKGWWRNEDSSDDKCVYDRQKSETFFPGLSKLVIEGCYGLTSFPPCQSLDTLHLTRSNPRLRIRVVKEDVIIRDLKIDNESYRESLPIGSVLIVPKMGHLGQILTGLD